MGMYHDGRAQRVSASWVDSKFKDFFIERVLICFGRWCYVPIGKAEPTAVHMVHHKALLDN